MGGKMDSQIKKYQLEHLVPLAITILAIYFLINNFETHIIYFVGLLISIVGLVIWWAAKITIGENWGAGYGKPKIKKLVTNGVYSKISHPLYWGVNLTLIGLCLIHKNILLIISSFLIVIYFFYRMKLETNFLIRTLGKKYIKYKSETWL